MVNIPNPSLAHIQKHGRIDVVGSCKGFLLLTKASSCFLYFIIWNPSIGLEKRFNEVLPKATYICGIGYDSSSIDDYVIMTITLGKEVHCFSTRSNSWSCIEGTVSYMPINNHFVHVSLLNGLWLVYSHDYHFKIIAFDLLERKLLEIPLPRELENHLCYLSVMGGCFYLWSRSYLPAQMWMMKEYKVQSSSTTIFEGSRRMSVSLSFDALYGFVPICFTKNGEIFGYGYTDNTLMRLIDKGKLHEQHRSRWSHFVMYRESLLSLSPNEEEQQ